MTLKILIVDADPAKREALRFSLETEGYAVAEAADGRNALMAMASELPALVLQDRVLLDMTGAELTGQLHALPGGSAIPTLYTSGLYDLERRSIQHARLIDIVSAYVPSSATRVAASLSRRVLVVDDDPVQLKLTCLHLELLGFDVASAVTVPEALRGAMTEAPDAVLCAVRPPELDGFQLCAELRKEPSLCRIPVPLASDWYETEADRELARQVGATALIRKSPDLGDVAPLLLAVMKTELSLSIDMASVQARLIYAQAAVRHLEQRLRASARVARRCTLQATQISLLGGAADALASSTDAHAALNDILGATLDAAGFSKGALFLQNDSGRLTPRNAIGFTSPERAGLEDFFGQMTALEEAVRDRTTLVIPSTIVRRALEANILAGAGSASAQIVSLTSEGRGVGALTLFASVTDVASDDSIAFARAMGNQLAQSLELASSFARLVASERRYRAVIETAHDAISIMRADGVIVDINPSFEAAIGRSRTQVVGHKLDEFAATTGDWTMKVAPSGPAEAALFSGLAVPLTRSDGTVALMEFSRKAVDLCGENVTVAIGRDVTERVQTQAQLMFSDRMATLGFLAAGVAHEINNPLTATIANLEIALQELAAAKGQEVNPRFAEIEELLRDAGEGAARVATIVRDLKIFSRAEEDTRGPVDILNVLESSLRMAWNAIGHRADLVREYSEVPPVEGNESRLGQVFLNLLVNAVQSLPEGRVHENRIVVRARCEPHEFIVIEVEDTGRGIAAGDIPRLFTPFFTTKPRGIGTGLGLAICKRIVTSFGGDISVHSELGRGTLFRVRLRASPAPVDAGAVRSQPESAARRAQILVVDDDPMAANAVRRILCSEHEVTVFHDAALALGRIVAGARFDLIICDVMMPDTTGRDFFEELTVIAREQADRIIFVTGGALTNVERDFLVAVPNPCLEKPFDTQALRSLVNARVDLARC